MRYFLSLIISLAIFSASIAQDVEKDATAFGVIPEYTNIEISPDGSKLLMFQNIEGQIILVTRSLEDMSAPMNGMPFPQGQYAWARWVSNTEFIAGLSFSGKSKGGNYVVELFGMVLSDWEGNNKELIADPDIDGRDRFPLYDLQIVDILEDDPDHILIQIAGDGNRERGWKRVVYKRNIRTQKMERYHQGIRTIKRWVTDEDNNVRLGLGFGNTQSVIRQRDIAHYRKDLESKWVELYDYVITYSLGFESEKAEKKPFTFENFSPDKSKIFVSKNNENGKRALYLYNVDTHEYSDEIVGHELYDIVDFEFDDDYNLLSYIYDGGEGKKVYVGERGERLNRIFEKSFPNSEVSIVSETRDKSIMVLRVSSPFDPGTFYLFNDKKHTIEMLSYNYQDVQLETLSDMQPISYQARDGLEIPSYLSLPKKSEGKNLPTLIMPHGGPLAHDRRRFDWWVQFLTNQGYAVLQMNYRGSTGYGEDFMRKGFHEWGRKMLEDINDGAKWIINEGIADPNRMCIVGWSYGGYAALQAIVKDQSLYKCSVSMAPVTDLDKEFKYLMTTYVESKEWTYDEGSPADNIDKINVPVLLLHGDLDRNVDVKHTRVFHKKMLRENKDIEYIEFENENHYLEKQSHRIKFLSETGKFLKEHIGG